MSPGRARSPTGMTQSRKLFVNVTVSDLARAKAFFGAIGFTFNPRFCDDTALCMVVSEEAYFMLLVPSRFRDFARKPVSDAAQQTEALYCFSVGSRAEVDAVADKALASGGSPAADPMDHGFMYARSFFDPDGHHWEVLWMDPEAAK
jgi:uncharacterized protein